MLRTQLLYADHVLVCGFTVVLEVLTKGFGGDEKHMLTDPFLTPLSSATPLQPLVSTLLLIM